MTLQDLINDHPEWADLPLAVYRPDGGLDFVGDAGTVYETEDHGYKYLVFAAN